MKIQLLTENQVNHLYNSLRNKLSRNFQKRVDEIKAVELTDEKIEAEVKINEDAIKYFKEREDKLSLLKRVASAIQALKDVDKNLRFKTNILSYVGEWRFDYSVEQYLDDTEKFEKAWTIDTETTLKALAESQLKKLAHIEDTYERESLLFTDLKARLALTKVDDLDIIEEHIMNSIDINDYITEL